jgi:hypothetical protein
MRNSCPGATMEPFVVGERERDAPASPPASTAHRPVTRPLTAADARLNDALDRLQEGPLAASFANWRELPTEPACFGAWKAWTTASSPRWPIAARAFPA